jgi:hypothetical protein
MDSVPFLGAMGFGSIIGWFVYYINRYRRADVQFSDLTTVVGIVGGAGVTSLFGGGNQTLFGAYGIGLFLGFFGYFLTLIILVRNSAGVFGVTWFLDGRRRNLTADESIQGDPAAPQHPMDLNPGLDQRVSALEQQGRK